MAITSILLAWAQNPSIVTVTTTDSLATITTAGYLADQADEIEALNNGAFDFSDTDAFWIAYSGGQGWFVYDSTNDTFLAETNPGSLSETLLDGRIFVGSAANVATGVVMSGDATIVNTGALTIAANAITTGKVANGAISSDKLAPNTIKYARVSLSAAQWNGMYATPVQIVAAQGAGTQIVVHAANLTMTFVAAQYAAGGVVNLQYTNTANGAGTAATGTVAAATINGLAASSALTLQGSQAAAAITAVQNVGIFISNQTAAFTTGDGTWVIDIWYSVKPA